MIENRVLDELSDRAWVAAMKRRAIANGRTWGGVPDVPFDFAAFRSGVLESAPKDLAALGVPHAHIAWENVRAHLVERARRDVAETREAFAVIGQCIAVASIYVKRQAQGADPNGYGPNSDDWREAQLRRAAVDDDELAAEIERDLSWLSHFRGSVVSYTLRRGETVLVQFEAGTAVMTPEQYHFERTRLLGGPRGKN